MTEIFLGCILYFNAHTYILWKYSLIIASSVEYTHVLLVINQSVKHPSGIHPFAHVHSALTPTELAVLQRHHQMLTCPDIAHLEQSRNGNHLNSCLPRDFICVCYGIVGAVHQTHEQCIV